MKLKPFYHAELPAEARDPHAIAARFGCTLELARRFVEDAKGEAIYRSEDYQVNVRHFETPLSERGMLWLSIKRVDKAPIHDWRALQAIKNAIVGPENEALELYPAESRVVDTANQYHLWVFVDPAVRIPVGFTERRVTDADLASAVGAVQRALDDDASNPAPHQL